MEHPEDGGPDARARAFGVMPMQVWTARPDGALDYVNPMVLDYFMVSEERILRDAWRGLCHPLDLMDAWQKWQDALATGEPYEVAFRLLRGRDRTYCWHVARAVPVRAADGTIDHWLGVNQEIDGLKRAEELGRATLERVQRERERWREIFETVPAPLVLTAGDDLVVEMCNAAACALTACARPAGLPLLEAFPSLSAQAVASLVERAKQDGQAAEHGVALRALRDTGGAIDGFVVSLDRGGRSR